MTSCRRPTMAFLPHALGAMPTLAWACRCIAWRRKRRHGTRVSLGGTALRLSHPTVLCTAGLVVLLISSGAAQAAGPADEADAGPGVSLTVYNQNFAIVKQRRAMPLAQGVGMVKFPDVAATIVPDSVQFSSLRPEGDAQVLEQNYEFDLVSADKLLEKYIDKKISVITRDGGLLEGTLLSADAGQLVLSGARGIDLVPRGKNVKDIRFSSLPSGLLTRPTLVWKVKAAHAGDHLVKIAYRANNMTWRVDYRAVAAADEKTLDLAGWVTITNQSGTTFENAGLKLMAGDVHVVQQERMRGLYLGARVQQLEPAKGEGRGFEEKSFAEYHLYTLGRTTTLANAQTKQIELINVEGIPVTKRYLVRTPAAVLGAQPGPGGQQVAVILEFKNSKETRAGLGIPLPKGPFRVYQIDKDKQAEFIGQDEIDHTPKDEPVRIRIGYAFDLVAQRVQTANRTRAGERWMEQDWKITLRNHKAEPVTIVVEEPLVGHVNWEIIAKSQEYRKKDYKTIEFDVPLPPNSEKTVTYTVRYTW
jgi:hypothetical protein